MSSNLPSIVPFQPAAAPIVGQTREQKILSERLSATLAGHGRLVLIGGEAGIGKTTLVDWLADEALRAGASALEGHCYDLTLTQPYGPWLEAFAGRDDTEETASSARHPLRTNGAPEAITSQLVLFEQVRADLASATARQPVVLMLEDLHWSDPASLDLLRYLARSIDALRLLLVATYRTDEITRRHPLFQLLPLLIRETRAERIDLNTFGDDDVRALVRSRYSITHDDETRLVAYLQARTEGNPFYLAEVLRTIEVEQLLQRTGDRWLVGDLRLAPVPPLVRQIIEGRLVTLGDETQRLLEIAAVIGQDVPLDVWSTASDSTDDLLALAIEQGIDAHLIAETRDALSVKFTHALVRETLYQRQVLPRRNRAHARVAELLAQRPDPPISLVASHFAQADDPRAIDWLVRAGERALALYAARDAVTALSRAQALAGRFARELSTTAYSARASAFAMLGEFDDARHDFETALERGRAFGDQRVEWQTLLDLGMLWAERDFERTGEHYRAALDLARVMGDASMVAYSLNRIANWHVNQDEPTAAIPLHLEALAIFEECGDRHGIAGTLDFLGMANFLDGDGQASTRHLERAIRLLRDLGDRQRLASSLATIIVNGGTLGHNVSACVYRETAFWFRSGEEGLGLTREIGWSAGEAYALVGLSLAAGTRGDLGSAFRDAEAARAIAEQIEHRLWTMFARHAIGMIWKELLDAGRAAAELERALADARIAGSRMFTTFVTTMLADLEIDEGNLAQAAALLGTIGQLDNPHQSLSVRECWFAHAKLALARGEPDRALTIVDRLRSADSIVTAEHGVPQLMRLHGAVLAQMGRYRDAERVYQAARDSAALFGFQPLLWRIDAARGDLYQSTGRTEAASTAYRAAQATIEQIAASVDDADVREHFRARAMERVAIKPEGVRRATSPAGLSPREMEVLRLVAEGKSDREIAEALFISPRTVNRHVTAILNKIGVNSRTSAAAFAIRQGIA